MRGILRRLLIFIISLFRREQFRLTHPEEPPDYSRTVENVNIHDVKTKWLTDYKVPVEYWDYWRNQIIVTLKADLEYPAAAYELNGVRHIDAKPAYFNAGVIAHEQAHNSYALLTEEMKREWDEIFPVYLNEPIIRYLWSVKPYTLSSPIEGHAEIYRYLAEQMPEELKEYYPKLF